jgi:phage terminase large subunit-like protein
MSWDRLFSTEPTSWSAFFGPSQSEEARVLDGELVGGYAEWLQAKFPHVATAPLGERHRKVWEWFESLSDPATPPPQVQIWPRGGAKTSTIQLAIARACERLSRRFILYVSETQDQASEHVSAIGDLLEECGLQPLRGEHGNQKGWRKSQLRTSTGFNVMGLGLDSAARGFKLGKLRPDLMVFDDIDGTEDTAKATAKKLRSIRKKLLPAGSSNCAVIFAQNMVIEDGVVAQLYDGRADFLQDRQTHFDVAIRGLKTQARLCEDGRTRHFIVGGEPTWQGQSIEIAQRQIHDWGISAFREEAQHEIQAAQGYFFDEKQYIAVEELPDFVRVVRAWDTAATQGGGDFTVGVLMGITANGVIWIIDVVRAQLAPDNVVKLQDMVEAWDRSRFRNYTVRSPQDPGSAGKRVAQEDRQRGHTVVAVTGSKAVRAKEYARTVNEGNARYLVDRVGGEPRPRSPQVDEFLARMTQNTEIEGKHGSWNHAFLSEHRKFREDESHDFDDQVDAAADAFNELNIAPVQVFVGRA